MIPCQAPALEGSLVWHTLREPRLRVESPSPFVSETRQSGRGQLESRARATARPQAPHHSLHTC